MEQSIFQQDTEDNFPNSNDLKYSKRCKKCYKIMPPFGIITGYFEATNEKDTIHNT